MKTYSEFKKEEIPLHIGFWNESSISIEEKEKWMKIRYKRYISKQPKKKSIKTKGDDNPQIDKN